MRRREWQTKELSQGATQRWLHRVVRVEHPSRAHQAPLTTLHHPLLQPPHSKHKNLQLHLLHPSLHRLWLRQQLALALLECLPLLILPMALHLPLLQPPRLWRRRQLVPAILECLPLPILPMVRNRVRLRALALLVCQPQALQPMVWAYRRLRLCPGQQQPANIWLQPLRRSGMRQSRGFTHTITHTITITITMSTQGMLP